MFTTVVEVVNVFDVAGTAAVHPVTTGLMDSDPLTFAPVEVVTLRPMVGTRTTTPLTTPPAARVPVSLAMALTPYWVGSPSGHAPAQAE